MDLDEFAAASRAIHKWSRHATDTLQTAITTVQEIRAVAMGERDPENVERRQLPHWQLGHIEGLVEKAMTLLQRADTDLRFARDATRQAVAAMKRDE